MPKLVAGLWLRRWSSSLVLYLLVSPVLWWLRWRRLVDICVLFLLISLVITRLSTGLEELKLMLRNVLIWWLQRCVFVFMYICVCVGVSVCCVCVFVLGKKQYYNISMYCNVYYCNTIRTIYCSLKEISTYCVLEYIAMFDVLML